MRQRGASLAAVLAAMCCTAAIAWGQTPPPSAGAGGAPQPTTAEGGAAADSFEPAEDPDELDTATEPEPAHPGEALEIYLLTVGPGSHPFFKFGHNAIWVHDETRTEPEKRDRVFNYGAINFAAPGLIAKFFLGRFDYKLTRRSLRKELDMYRAENRWLSSQKLNLTPEQRHQLHEFLKWNRKKANRYYRYHYFRDNCSTRVRDAIDRVIGGRIRHAAAGPAELGYREHTLRLTASLLPEYVMLNLVASDYADQPITRWDETFIPGVLQQLVRDVTVVGPDGDQPLVAEEKLLLKTDREPPPQQPPGWLRWFLLSGLVLGGALAALGRLGQARRRARWVAAVTLGGVGLVFGLLGTLLVAVWLFTDHDVMWRNENILQCAPWLLGLPVVARGLARSRSSSTTVAFWLCLSAAVAAGLGLVLKILPWFQQDNSLIIAATLPIAVGAMLATHWLRAATAAPTKDATPSGG